MVLKNRSLAMLCVGQSWSRPLSTSRSIVVFKQPTSPKRTSCQIVLFRVFRLEATCPCVLLVSLDKGGGVGNSRAGITKKALFLSLIVILGVCPEHREGHLRLRVPQDQDRSMILEIHTRSAGSSGGQRHRSERLCRVLGSNIDRDEDLAGTSLWSPDIEGVVSADRWGQMIAPTKLHERSSLTIIGGKDAGHPLLIRWQAVIHLSNQGDLLLPAKAIGQGLRQAIAIACPCTATLAIHLCIHGRWQHRHHRRGQQHANYRQHHRIDRDPSAKADPPFT